MWREGLTFRLGECRTAVDSLLSHYFAFICCCCSTAYRKINFDAVLDKNYLPRSPLMLTLAVWVLRGSGEEGTTRSPYRAETETRVFGPSRVTLRDISPSGGLQTPARENIAAGIDELSLPMHGRRDSTFVSTVSWKRSCRVVIICTTLKCLSL